jgi:hypothetical protein
MPAGVRNNSKQAGANLRVETASEANRAKKYHALQIKSCMNYKCQQLAPLTSTALYKTQKNEKIEEKN